MKTVPEEHKEKIRSEWQIRHEKVIDSGGLHIIGTERHESRRIDNQLRGRSGRQGDPGSSRFYLSLEDNLMRIFASDRMASMMQRFGMKEDEAIEAGMLNRAIENAQRKVEAHNFDVRKHLLDYDDVANDQRRVVYSQRNELMEAEEIGETILDMRHDVFHDVIDQFIPPGSIDEQWEVPALEKALEGEFGVQVPVIKWLSADEQIHEEVLRERIIEAVDAHFLAKEEQTGAPVMRHFEKALMLNVLDQHWKDHLASMDYLRQGIGLRGYAHKTADAGIQARILRNVHRTAGQHQAGSDPDPRQGPGQSRRRRRSRGCAAPPGSTNGIPPRRSRHGRGGKSSRNSRSGP